MKRSDSSYADRLVYEEPLGLAVWGAVAFYLLLLAGMAALWWFDLTPWIYVIVGFLVFSFIRHWLTTSSEPVLDFRGRRLPDKRPVRLELDRRQGTATVSFSRLRQRVEIYRFEAFECVLISLKRTRHGRSSSFEYLLHLVGPAEAVLAGWSSTYSVARATAGEIAAFLQTQVVDAAQGDPVVLRGEDVNRSIREQEPDLPAGAGGADPGGPPPGNPRLQYEWRGSEFVFRDMPDAKQIRGNFRSYVVILVVLLGLAPAVGAWLSAHRNPNDAGIEFCCPSVFLLLALGWSWLYFTAIDELVTLTVNPSGLTLVRQYRRRSTTQAYPVERVLEIRLINGCQIHVVTDRSVVWLLTLKKDDAEWLRACILRALRS